ncbi:hypothetical protein D1007_45916 [Hordeum vulgare]|nr:hypothetical protein D1007_45916 [Hordeum vulgare]
MDEYTHGYEMPNPDQSHMDVESNINPFDDVETKGHNKDYARWRKNCLAQGSMDEIATWLVQKPSPTVLMYQAYDIKSYTFYTKERDEKTSYRKSSIRLE